MFGQSSGSFARGVLGTNSGSDGIGVSGQSTGAEGIGVFGSNSSVSGYGVYGNANSNSGTNYGVYGKTRSSDGYAGYFEGGRNYFQGNVGMGTLNPFAPLSVLGTTNTQTVRFEGPLGNYRFLQQLDDSDLASWIFRNGTSGTAFKIASDGNVGIGTATPTFLLEVDGSAGKPGGGSWSNSSDRRLKKNIRDLNSSLDQLMKLRGVRFEYKKIPIRSTNCTAHASA